MTTTCRKCDSDRIASIDAQCRDQCSFLVGDRTREENYPPSGVGIGGGDFVEFDYCLNCGAIQSDKFPISEEAY